jgi:asparagine synthase (glutamine-hydrolysing)
MCGINGVLSVHGPTIKKEDIVAMNAAIRNRGPDDEGVALFPESYASDRFKVGLGHKRLSIIDLNPRSKQPMKGANGATIVYNGELYNYHELKSLLSAEGYPFITTSDTEVILAAYEIWGKNAFARFNGIYAFAIWDSKHEELILVRDKVGIKPLYYYWDGYVFAFSSEIKGLKALPFLDFMVNRKAVADFFTIRYIPHPESIFKNTIKLEPGCMLTIAYESISVDRYTPKITGRKKGGEGNFVGREFQSILTNAIGDQLMSDVPVGCFLSSGVDSSLVTAIANEISEKPVSTFTIGFTNENFDESPNARKIAKHLGTQHHERIVSASDMLNVLSNFYRVYDEPFGDSSAIPTILLAEMVKGHAKVCLSGDGGDELFYGYNWFRQIERLRSLYSLPGYLRKPLFNLLLKHRYHGTVLEGLKENSFSDAMGCMSAFSSIERNELVGEQHGTYRAMLNEIFPDKPSNVTDLYYDLYTMGFESWLPGDFLVKVDRASMANGIEVRVPLLDNRVIEYTSRLSPDEIRTRGDSKYQAKQLLANYLPPQLIEQPKKGFSIPLRQWLSKDLKEYVMDEVKDTERFGILNKSVVTREIDSFYKNPARSNPLRLWLILSFHMWCKEYLS